MKIVLRKLFSFLSLTQNFKVFPIWRSVPCFHHPFSYYRENMLFNNGTVSRKGGFFPAIPAFLKPHPYRFPHCYAIRQTAASTFVQNVFSLPYEKFFLHFLIGFSINGTISFPSVSRVIHTITTLPAAILSFIYIFSFSCHNLLHYPDEIFDGP